MLPPLPALVVVVGVAAVVAVVVAEVEVATLVVVGAVVTEAREGAVPVEAVLALSITEVVTLGLATGVEGALEETSITPLDCRCVVSSPPTDTVPPPAIPVAVMREVLASVMLWPPMLIVPP
jgi:hypothetical protein